MRPARPHPRSRRHAVTCIPEPPTAFTKLVCNRLGASPPVCCAVRFPCRGGSRVSWLPPGNTRGSWCREPSKPVGRLRSSTPHALGQTRTPASPEVACAGGAYLNSTSTTPRGCVHKEAQKRPSGAPYRAGSRPSGPTRPRQRHPRLGRSCLRVLPRAGARPSGTKSPRQRHPRLGRSCLQSRCAPVGYEEPERMPEVPQTWMVEGPPAQPKPSPGRASVPQGSLPSPKRSILM